MLQSADMLVDLSDDDSLIVLVVPLLTNMMRLSLKISDFPFNLKMFQRLVKIQKERRFFVPCAQYILYPFDQINFTYFSSSGRSAPDSVFPPESLTFDKCDIVEVKENIISEVIKSLIEYYAPLSANLSFPELILPTQVVLERFRQNTPLKKHVSHFLDLVQKNIDFVAAQRAKITDKSFKDSTRLIQQFNLDLHSTPLWKEASRFPK